jgi:hypothetical protein
MIIGLFGVIAMSYMNLVYPNIITVPIEKNEKNYSSKESVDYSSKGKQVILEPPPKNPLDFPKFPLVPPMPPINPPPITNVNPNKK